jgi:hypothetical protein
MEHHEFHHARSSLIRRTHRKMRADPRDEKRQFFSLNVHWYRFRRVVDIKDTFCQ